MKTCEFKEILESNKEESVNEDIKYYQSQLSKLGKAEWPDVTIVLSNNGTKTKFLTLTPDLVSEIAKWVKKQGIKPEENK